MSVADQIRQAQQAATSIATSVGDIRQAIAAKQAELDRAKSDSGPPAEVIAERNRYLDEMAHARAAQQHDSAALVRMFGAPVGHSAGLNRRGPDTPFTWADACFYFGDTIKATDAAGIAAYAYTPGPAKAERAAVVAKIEAELTELTRAEEELVDNALAVGVKLEHRPEVTQRRERERSQRERTERAADAERRAAEAGREADDWPTPRGSRSSYIHGRG